MTLRERLLRVALTPFFLFAAVAWYASAESSAQSPKPADLRWVPIPGNQGPATPWHAEFQMGCVPRDRNCQAHEMPRHTVTLTRPFAMLATETAVGQFRAFANATGYRTAAEREGWSFAFDGSMYVQQTGLSWTNPGFPQDDRHPVVHVSWDDAVAFCAWAGGRLPTEAEWEYAARGGIADGLYVWGDKVLAFGTPKSANVADERVRTTFPKWAVFTGYDDGYAWTSPVGLYEPNAFGLFDMAGNAWEWTADWYSANAYSTASLVDPHGPPSGQDRVVRGSSWGDEPEVLRISERAHRPPTSRSYFHGFRCAQDVP
jgi:formylglycine-generating enzyme required for sulfatase activity